MQEAEWLPEDQAVQDEELLREYLDARIAQTVIELESVQNTLALDPKNLDKANRLWNMFAQIRDMRGELATQRTKLAAAKEAARAARLARGLPVDALDDAAASAQPTNAFRSSQANKAEHALKAAGVETKNCPKCRAVLPQPAALCFCGFNFAQGEADNTRVGESGVTTSERTKLL